MSEETKDTEYPSSADLKGVHAAQIFRDLPEGLYLGLIEGAKAEIVTNPGDGCYLLLKILENPADESRVGTEEIVYFTDVTEILGHAPQEGNS